MNRLFYQIEYDRMCLAKQIEQEKIIDTCYKFLYNHSFKFSFSIQSVFHPDMIWIKKQLEVLFRLHIIIYECYNLKFFFHKTRESRIICSIKPINGYIKTGSVKFCYPHTMSFGIYDESLINFLENIHEYVTDYSLH